MFTEDLTSYLEEYCAAIPELAKLNRTPNKMLIDFCVEKFKQLRNYPKTFSEEKIEADLYQYKSTIAMAVIDLFNKEGAEGETSHSESGITRNYESAFVSSSVFRNVVPFIGVIL